MAFLALATLHREEAIDHLLGVVREGEPRSAERAVKETSFARRWKRPLTEGF